MTVPFYWAGTGTYQALNDKLHALIPSDGECPKDQPKLEKLRRATNCYYDMYNNGLCNRAAEFRRVFGFGGSQIARHLQRTPELEEAMDSIILAAGLEQGLCKIVPYDGVR